MEASLISINWWMDKEGVVHISVSSIMSPSCEPMDCSTPGLPVHHQLSSLLQLMSIKLVMPPNYLILSCPLLFLPSIFPSIRVFSNESVLHIRWPKYIYIYIISNIYTYTCCIYMYTIEYYSAIKNNEILPFAATWMDLEIITLSAVSQTKTDIILYHLYVKYKTKKWYKHIYLQNGNRLTDI